MRVVLIHGNGVDHRLLEPLDPVLAAAGLERTFLDLPGFGGTAPLPAPGGLPEIADHLESRVREAAGSAPVALLGNSLGGLLAREIAVRLGAQCRGLALLAPVIDPVAEHRTLPSRTVLHADPELLAQLDPADAALYAEMAVEQTREGWERFARWALPGIRAADPEALARLGERYVLPVLPDAALARMDVPVLIVSGRQDHVVGWEDQEGLAARLPRARSVVLERAGHNVHLDQPVAVDALLAQWAGELTA